MTDNHSEPDGAALFATMAAELPDFIDSLVGIAQRGRSLDWLGRTISESHGAETLEIGPAREIIAMGKRRFGRRPQHCQCRYHCPWLRGGDRFGADERQPDAAGKRRLSVTKRRGR